MARLIGWTCCQRSQEPGGTGEADGRDELSEVVKAGGVTDPMDSLLDALLVVGNVDYNQKNFKPRPSVGVSGLLARVCGLEFV